MQEVQETQALSLGLEDPLEKEMVSHSSILAWEIPWAEETGRLESMGSWKVRPNWATEHTHTPHAEATTPGSPLTPGRERKTARRVVLMWVTQQTVYNSQRFSRAGGQLWWPIKPGTEPRSPNAEDWSSSELDLTFLLCAWQETEMGWRVGPVRAYQLSGWKVSLFSRTEIWASPIFIHYPLCAIYPLHSENPRVNINPSWHSVICTERTQVSVHESDVF